MNAGVLALGAGLLAITAAAVVAVRRIPVTVDEAWFLQVIVRQSRGEVLYRDVFYGAGPLPVWIGGLAVRGRRRPMLVLRVVGILYFMGLLLAGSWVLASAHAPAPAFAVLWIGSLAFVPPTSTVDSHYTRVALLTAVLATGIVMHIGSSGAEVAFVLAGAAAGLSFSAKQTIGIAATVALGASAIVVGGFQAAVWYVLGAVVAAGVCLVPLARVQALGWYVRRSFRNKTVYLAVGRVGFRDGLREALRRTFSSRAQQAVYGSVAVAAYLVFPAVLVACAIALRNVVVDDPSGSARLSDMATLALGAVVCSAAVPRLDFTHVRGLFPVALLTVALAVGAHPASMHFVPDGARLTATAGLLLVTALAAAISARRVQLSQWSNGPVDHTTPYFEGLPVLHGTTPSGPADGAALRERTGGRVFLLRPDASFWYLASGLENPTPYDYPFASVFGPRGQQEVIEGIRAGRIAWVCSPGPTDGRQRPAQLEEFVARSMVAVEQTSAGVLYRLAADPTAGSSGPDARRS